MSHTAKDTHKTSDRRSPIGVVLAGGLARRMGGGDKALLSIGGQTILDHIIERLSGQCERLILNVNGPSDRFTGFGLPIIADTIPDHAGPLAGILAALDWIAETHPACPTLLSVAGDTPFLPKDLVVRLELARNAAQTPLACAKSGGQMHPPFSLWPVSLRFVLREALVSEQIRKMETVMTRQGCATAIWDTDPLDPFFNINQPEDVAMAEALYSKLQPDQPGEETLTLDLKGLKCPLPALRTAKALARLKSGAEMMVVCTDPMAQIDIPHLVQSEGHTLLSQRLEAERCVFVIRKGA
jgi:molybdopterin-guanine dinucleotide biosynthesis protein A